MRFRMGLAPIAACCALFAIPQFAAGQSKVAIVNMQQAILGTAEIKKADADMAAKYSPKQAELDKLNSDIQKLQQTIQVGQDTLAAAALGDLNSQLSRKQREVQRLQEDYQADAERDRNEVLSGTSQKMAGVVKKLAEERGLDLVLDASNAIFFKDAMDITKFVIEAYDKAFPAAAAKPAAK